MSPRTQVIQVVGHALLQPTLAAIQYIISSGDPGTPIITEDGRRRGGWISTARQLKSMLELLCTLFRGR